MVNHVRPILVPALQHSGNITRQMRAGFQYLLLGLLLGLASEHGQRQRRFDVPPPVNGWRNAAIKRHVLEKEYTGIPFN